MNKFTTQLGETRKAFLLAPALLASLLILSACAGDDEMMADTMDASAADSAPLATTADSSGAADADVAAADIPPIADPNPGSEDDLELNVGDRVLFATDSSELDGQAQETLRRQAEWLLRYTEIFVRIEGHADERGTREYNLALGQRRANRTREYLISLGIDANRLSTISYGKERPLALCSNENCWRQNRRAVTTVVAPGS